MSKTLYFVGNIAHFLCLYCLYNWAMTKSSDLDAKNKLWKAPAK